MAAEVRSVPDVTSAALQVVLDCVRRAVAERGRAVLVLAGGSTPLSLYGRLAEEDLPWERLHVLWGDERFVAPRDPASNVGAAMAALLGRVPVPEANVLRWPLLETPAASAEAYQDVIVRALGPDPVFDVTLLGLGADGHTASLFPGTGDALRPGFAFATRAPASSPVRDRLTLSARTLSRSRTVVFLVSGAAKREALDAAFGPAAPPPPRPGRSPGADAAAVLDAHPARAVTALERLLVITDQDLRT